MTETHSPNPYQKVATLATQITPSLVAAGPRALRSFFDSDTTRSALARCITAGLFALITPTQLFALPDYFEDFIRDPDAIRQWARVLNGESPNADELSTIYKELAQGNTALNVEQATRAFGAAFASALQLEPELLSNSLLKKAQQSLQQQAGMPASTSQHLDNAIAQLRELALGNPALNARDIHAQNVVSGIQQIIHQHFYAARAPQWEEHYLRTLIARCDPLDLLPLAETHVDEQGRQLQPVGISDVFATLNVSGLTRMPDDTLGDIAQYIASANAPLPQYKDWGADVIQLSDNSSLLDDKIDLALSKRPRQQHDKNEDAIPIQAVEAVAAVSRLVILGQPGGGKSSLVNHLAVQLARRRLNQRQANERLPGWDVALQPIPIKIVVREFAEWLSERLAKGEVIEVWGYMAQLLQQWGCAECFAELKERVVNEGGLILFDGLDEVRADDEAGLRETIKQAITDFAAPLLRSKVVLTCREYAYQPPDPKHQRSDWHLPTDVFPVFTLAPLTPDQIDQFVHDWYRITGPLPPRFWDAAHCQSEADNLAEAIRDEARPYLLDLAENPLLLTLMAQVHGKDGVLPNDRADLYERAVRLLLDRWEARLERDASGGRVVASGIYTQLGISPEGLSVALQEVAFVAHTQQGQAGDSAKNRRAANITEPVLLQQLKRHLKDDYGKAQLAARFIHTRAGLLVAHAGETYSFPHRTFQEYLAACHIMRMGEPAVTLRELLATNLAWWREVFLLAAGTQRKQPKLIRELVEAVLVTMPNTEMLVNHLAGALLVEQAMHETRFRDEVTREPRTAQPGPFLRVYQNAQQALLCAMQSPLGLSATERAQAGTALARLGDPRFDPQTFYLTAEDNLGFVLIPADPNFKIGTCAKDFERVMRTTGVEEKNWDNRRNEINDEPSPTPLFYMARYPVTAAQWRTFVEDKRRVDPGFKIAHEASLRGTDNHPAIDVSWHDAMAYCAWLNAQLKTAPFAEHAEISQLVRSGAWHITLPSELEWEQAARGGDDTIFGYGDVADSNKANYADSKINATSAVGCFAPNAFGCADMVGNVLEWTRSIYRPYPYNADDGRERLDASERRVLRGGSWLNDRQGARVAYRSFNTPDNRSNDLGFRLVCAPVLPPVASGSLPSDPLGR